MGATLQEIYESIQKRKRKEKKHKKASEGQLITYGVTDLSCYIHYIKKIKIGFTSKDTLRDFSLLFIDRFCLEDALLTSCKITDHQEKHCRVEKVAVAKNTQSNHHLKTRGIGPHFKKSILLINQHYLQHIIFSAFGSRILLLVYCQTATLNQFLTLFRLDQF